MLKKGLFYNFYFNLKFNIFTPIILSSKSFKNKINYFFKNRVKEYKPKMQMDEYQFLTIYKNAYQSHNNQTRQENTDILNTMITKNPELFTYLSCNSLKNPNSATNDRKLIIIGLTKSLRPNTPHQPSIWPKIPQKQRQDLKNSALTILIDPNDEIKHKAANLIAALYVLDLKDQRQWTQLLKSLSENVKNKDTNIQKAAIITLGYICENLFNDNYVNLKPEEIDTLLGGICLGLDEYGELSKTSVMALGYSISFLKGKLGEEEIRDYIFDILVRLLIKASEDGNVEVVIPTISCLEEISRVTFEFFGKYFDIVFRKVLGCNFLKDSKNLIMTINEFFKTLLETEKDFGLKIFDSFWEELANYCLKSLLDLNETVDDDEGGLSLKKSFFYLLNTINSLYIRETQKNLINFVYNYIDNDDPKIKVVSLVVFETLLESSPYEEMKKDLNDCFFGLLNFISDNDYQLRIQSLSLLLKISEYHVQVIMEDANYTKFINTFSDIIMDEDFSIDKMKIKIQTLKILEKTVISSAKKNIHHKFENNMENFYKIIFDSLKNCKNLVYINDAFTVIFAFSIHICPLPQISKYYIVLQNMMMEIPTKYSEKELQFIYLEAYQINLTTMLNRVHQAEFNFLIENRDPCDTLSTGFKFMLQFCEKYQEIPDESLYYMAIILIHSPYRFQGQVIGFLKNFITPALKSLNNIRLFKNGVDAFLLIVKAYTDICAEYVREVLPLFLGYINNPEIERELNQTFFFAFSDLAFYFPNCTVDHLNDIFHVIKLASDAILYFLKSDKKSDCFYANDLVDAVLNLFICIIHGFYLEENERFKQFEGLIENKSCEFIVFLEDVCNLKKKTENEFLLGILGFMIDFYQKKKNVNLLNKNFIDKIVEIFRNGPSNSDFDQFEDYYNQILANANSNIIQ